MILTIAEFSGFCFGVKRAVGALDEIVATGQKNAYTYGEIIHNKSVVCHYMQNGITPIKGMTELRKLKKGSKVVVRAHGVPKQFFAEAENLGLRVVDATCPYVSKIHKIVERESEQGKRIIVFGDPDHPEVQGVVGWSRNGATVLKGLSDVVQSTEPCVVVIQTTFDRYAWGMMRPKVEELFPNATIYDTICSATDKRQNSARELAKRSDLMIVVGDTGSSNTKKLFKICEKFTDAILIENADQLVIDELKDKQRIGIIGGASTPDDVIDQVVLKINEERNTK